MCVETHIAVTYYYRRFRLTINVHRSQCGAQNREINRLKARFIFGF